MVEAEIVPGDLGFGVPARILRVVGGRERAAADAAGIDGRDGVLARIPPGVGVGEKLLDELDFEACLLACLAPAGVAQLLAMVDEAPRRPPPGGPVFRRMRNTRPSGPAMTASVVG